MTEDVEVRLAETETRFSICRNCGTRIELDANVPGWRFAGSWREVTQLEGYIFRENEFPFLLHEPLDPLVQDLWELDSPSECS